jgi:hypothetical protein
MAAFWVVAPCRLVEVRDDRPDDEGSTDLRHVGKLIRVYAALQPRKQASVQEKLYSNRYFFLEKDELEKGNEKMKETVE